MEAVLHFSHLWGTIKYLTGLCKKNPIQYGSPRQWGWTIENLNLIPSSSINYNLGPPEGILSPSFHAEVAEVAISSALPFKKALQELAVLPRNPQLLLSQTFPPFPTSAAEKPICNSNDIWRFKPDSASGHRRGAKDLICLSVSIFTLSYPP